MPNRTRYLLPVPTSARNCRYRLRHQHQVPVLNLFFLLCVISAPVARYRIDICICTGIARKVQLVSGKLCFVLKSNYTHGVHQKLSVKQTMPVKILELLWSVPFPSRKTIREYAHNTFSEGAINILRRTRDRGGHRFFSCSHPPISDVFLWFCEPGAAFFGKEGGGRIKTGGGSWKREVPIFFWRSAAFWANLKFDIPVHTS